MTGIITEKFKTNSANQFITDVKSSDSNYYVFVGKHTPWDDDNSPPAITGSIYNTEQNIYHDLLYGKRVTETDVMPLAPKFTWNANTVYAAYSISSNTLYGNNYYVITNANNIYKVIDNNYGASSTVKPEILSTEIFKTSDGYSWKYMYTVDVATMSLFTCNTFIPIIPNTSVVAAAVPGSIDILNVSDSGEGYITYHTGTLVHVTNSTAMILSNTASTNTGFYTDSSIYFKSGLGAGQIRKISNYIGGTKQVLLESPIDFYVILGLDPANTIGSFAIGDVIEQGSANGNIIFSDTDSVELNISDLLVQFELGETVVQTNSSSTGVVSYANNTQLIITSVTGAGFEQSNSTYDYRIQGLYSGADANVTLVTSKPTVTVEPNYGTFTLGSNVSTSSGGISNSIVSITTSPDTQTEYIISPTITITGDGQGAQAYSICNTTTNTIHSAIIINPGNNYTNAVVTVTNNPDFGNGAVIVPVIAPMSGHGGDPINELGGNYAGVTVTFSNSYTEGYMNIPGYGEFRKLGLIKDVMIRDLWLTIDTFDRATLSINTTSAAFESGEIVYQPTSNAAGIVVFANSTVVELKNVRGTVNSAANVYGLSSDANANLANVTINEFTVTTGTQEVVQETTGAKGILVFANTSVVNLTNVTGTFTTSEMVYDSSTNSYATISNIKINNNSKAYNFTKFNNLARVTLASNTGAFLEDETVILMAGASETLCTAEVVNANNDIDISVGAGTGSSFILNEIVTQGSANAVVAYSNSTYIKLTNVKGTISNTANIVGLTSSNEITPNVAYGVIILSDIIGTLPTSSQDISTNYFITDRITDNIQGYIGIANTVTLPEVVRNSGSVLYIENISPVTKTDQSKETVRLVLKF